MDDTLAQWLALREPADTASRSVDLTRAIADTIRGRDPLRVLDLATGTGANIRYLMPRFPVRLQHWLAVDHSPTLLAHCRSGCRSGARGVDTKLRRTRLGASSATCHERAMSRPGGWI